MANPTNQPNRIVAIARFETGVRDQILAEGAPSPIAQSPDLAKTFEHIWMAPFCAHDCFHLHWRWADYFGDEAIQFKGWSGSASATRAIGPRAARGSSRDTAPRPRRPGCWSGRPTSPTTSR